ncbi:MAG: hypothetical protein ACK56F_05925 [bacterium]
MPRAPGGAPSQRWIDAAAATTSASSSACAPPMAARIVRHASEASERNRRVTSGVPG